MAQPGIVGEGGPAALEPPGVGLNAPPAPASEPALNYREYYWARGLAPPLDRIANYLGGYRFTDPGGGGIPTPSTLRDQTVALSDRQPLAFLCMLPGSEGNLGDVTVVHRFVRYLDAPGEDPTGFSDKVLGLLGDILPHQYPVVEVPGTAFHLVGTPVRVPTVAAMAALLPTWDDNQAALGPYTEQDPETEVVRPRFLQLVPPRLAAVLIHRRRVKAKTPYQELLAGAIQAEGGTEAYSDVLVWLRAACTARGGGGPQNAIPSVVHAFAPVFLPPEVHDYVVSKVAIDLPALGRRSETGQGTTDALVGAIRSLTAARNAGIAGEDEAIPKAPKSVADTYRETYRTLLRFSNVQEVGELSPLWMRLANCHKSEQHTVLTQEFQKVCMARGLSTELYTPIVTTTLKQMIVSFHFGGNGPDDLSSGCQPFLVSYAGSANHYMAVAAASVGNQLAQNEQTASLADYRTIRDKEKIKFPNDVSETSITLYRFAILCQVLFQGTGPSHPLVQAMWATALGLQNISPFVADRHQSVSRVAGVGATYFARILRAIQLGVHEYLQQVAVNVEASVMGIEVPSFTTMLQDLKRGTFHVSTNWIALPDTYLTSHTPSTQSVSSGGRSAAVTISGSSAATSVSSLTQDPVRETVTRTANPAPDSEFAALTIRSGGTRAALRAHRPPSNDAGQEFCVAWWLRGGCYPNCGRRDTHRPFASPAERTRLLSYVREHLVATADT